MKKLTGKIVCCRADHKTGRQ